MSKKLILVGGGGHACSCIDVIQSSSHYSIQGYLDIDSTTKLRLQELTGVAYLGDDSCIKLYSLDRCKFLISVGQIKSSLLRQSLFNKVQLFNSVVFPIVSSKATVSTSSSLGLGTICMHQVHVGPHTHIGQNTILNTRCIVDHNSYIGDHCHISTGAIINGDCHIGNGVFIGSGAIVYQGIHIADDSVVQAGAIVDRDILGGIHYR